MLAVTVKMLNFARSKGARRWQPYRITMTNHAGGAAATLFYIRVTIDYIQERELYTYKRENKQRFEKSF